MSDRVALVTGGTRGIGAETVKVFHREDWNTFVTDSKSHDVRYPENCQRAVRECIRKYGYLDCLVNNAGIVRNTPYMMMSHEDWHDVLDVNVHGMHYMTKAALGPLRKTKGSIINLSSIAAICGITGQVNYSTAKAAVLGFTRSLARELAQMNTGIRVNAIVAGAVETDMTRDDMQMKSRDIKCFIPMKKVGEPRYIAEMIYFLASEKSGYTTGVGFQVDGGLVIGYEG